MGLGRWVFPARPQLQTKFFMIVMGFSGKLIRYTAGTSEGRCPNKESWICPSKGPCLKPILNVLMDFQVFPLNTFIAMIVKSIVVFITARKRSVRRLCFYRCLSFCPQGGHAWLPRGGACVVAPGGACVVARGACMVAPGGRAWFFR